MIIKASTTRTEHVINPHIIKSTQINMKQIVCLLTRTTATSSLGKKVKLIKERIGLNWKPIVTFRNHIHKSTQYYFIDTNAGNGFG